jgi:GntR family transcriptional regulator
MRQTAYNEVAIQMRKRILSGRWAPGGQLAGERELCEEFGVSRITLRHALRLMSEEGLIHKRHGSGNYIAPQPTPRIPVMIDYTGSMRDHAPNLKRRVLESGLKPVMEAQANELELAISEPVFTALRIDSLDGVELAFDHLFISRQFAKGLTKADLMRVDFLECWTKRERFAVHHYNQTVEAIASTGLTEKLLGIPVGAPVLKATEVFYAGPLQPAGMFVTCYNPQHICIRSSMRWQKK